MYNVVYLVYNMKSYKDTENKILGNLLREPLKNKNSRGKDKDESAQAENRNRGEVIYDATVCPQDIAYPTDLGLLNKAREITEGIIDELHTKNRQGKKPRTYRKIARKANLKVAQNKNPSKKGIRKGIKSQLQYLKRNFKTIEKQLDSFAVFPLRYRLQRTY